MTRLELLKEIESELKRFQKKLKLAKEEVSNPENNTYGGSRKHYASARRSALDLKNELTRLTQDSKYLYE